MKNQLSNYNLITGEYIACDKKNLFKKKQKQKYKEIENNLKEKFGDDYYVPFNRKWL